jgi:cytochrome c-type biogenesis protein CcmH/NrfG
VGFIREMLAKLKALGIKVCHSVESDLVDTYERVKVYLLAILAIVAVWEWRKLKEALLVKMGQKQIDSSNKEDKKLATQENNDEQQAIALEKKAQDEPNPGDGWYKDEK